METKPNVIVIILDCLRKDFSKELENKLIEYSFIAYENVVSPSPWTVPTHASIFTGLYPLYHGAHETKTKKGSEVRLVNKQLITHQLKDYGYFNYLFTANVFVTPIFGFKGFDYVEFLSSKGLTTRNWKELEKIKTLSLKYNSKTKIIKKLIKDGEFRLLLKLFMYLSNKFNKINFHKRIKWPKEKGSSQFIRSINNMELKTPFFLFSNLIELHEPYFMHDIHYYPFIRQNVDETFIKRLRQKYREGVSYVTQKMTRLIEILKEKNLFDDSLIIVTSDHGQLLGENGRFGHGTFLDDELLSVPLLIKFPKDFDVKMVSKGTRKYISLVKLKSFILESIKYKQINDAILYSDVVFSESYGTHISPNRGLVEYTEKLEMLEKYRVAAFSKGYKYVFNVDEWSWDTWYPDLRYDVEGSAQIGEEVRNKVISYIKMGINTIHSIKTKKF